MASGSTLGKAYVQIVPSAQGIKGSISNLLNGEGESAGHSVGGKLVSTLKNVLAAAGIGKALISSMNAGGQLEQSIGGIETLYKDSADAMKQYANNAFKSAGMSANDYMQTATSFAAGLVSSCVGNTKQAAETANMAITDMSDNANKMGTSMESIQNAYQGFAKQNYTMLDNLKLGYGGTKSEMERLLADAEKLTGIKYDINNLKDVYSAIHVIQNELGITGTTAKEAASTFEGSMNMLKASFQNVLAGLSLNYNIEGAVSGLVESLVYVTKNVARMLLNIIQTLPTAINALFSSVAGLIPQNISLLSSQFMSSLPGVLVSINASMVAILDGITAQLPMFLQAGADMILNIVNGITTNGPMILYNVLSIIQNIQNAILTALPMVLSKVNTVITAVISALASSLPQFMQTGANFVINMINGLVAKGPDIMKELNNIITNMIAQIGSKAPDFLTTSTEILLSVLQTIMDALPQFLEGGVNILMNVIDGVVQQFPNIMNAFSNIIISVIDFLMDNLPQFLQKGIEMILKLANGVLQNLPTIISAISSVILKVITHIVSRLPEFLAQGVALIAQLAIGLVNSIPNVISSAKQIISGIKNAFTSINWGSIGVNIVSGIINGIGSMIGSLVSVAVNMARSAFNSAKSALGIHSPSRKFAYIGEMTAVGFANGIEDNASLVTNAMDDLTSSFDDSLEGQLKTAISADVAGTYGNVSSGMSTNSDIYSKINDLITLIQNGSIAVIMDSGAVVGELAPSMDIALGQLAIRKGRG